MCVCDVYVPILYALLKRIVYVYITFHSVNKFTHDSYASHFISLFPKWQFWL